MTDELPTRVCSVRVIYSHMFGPLDCDTQRSCRVTEGWNPGVCEQWAGSRRPGDSSSWFRWSNWWSNRKLFLFCFFNQASLIKQLQLPQSGQQVWLLRIFAQSAVRSKSGRMSETMNWCPWLHTTTRDAPEGEVTSKTAANR